MTKLPIFTKLAPESSTDFEWPTQVEFDSMNFNVGLKSITFKAHKGAISSVQCTLTNGLSSLVYEQTNVEHESQKTIKFDSMNPIDEIRGYQKICAEGLHEIKKIVFHGKKTSKIDDYGAVALDKKSKNFAPRRKAYHEIVGIYGTFGVNSLIDLGFIMKVKSSQD